MSDLMKDEIDLPVAIGSSLRTTICILIAICIGCNGNNDPRKTELSPQDPIKLTIDSDYYTSLPPLDRPPDGTFPAGTVVSVMVDQDSQLDGAFFVEQEGVRGFVLMQTKDGFQAYVDITGIVDASDGASPPDSDDAAEQSEEDKSSSAPKARSPDSVGSQSSESKLHNTAATGSLTRNSRIVCL